MKNKNLWLLVFVFFLTVHHAEAQEKMVKGYVTTFDSIPVINAEVLALKSKKTVLTDSLGNFEINCSKKDKLKVSAQGFISQKVKIKNEIKFAMVNLKLKSGSKSQEIAIAYGHVKDADRLSAVSSLNSEGNNFYEYSNMYDLLRRQLPGVEVRGTDIIVRGENSVNGSSAALIVVDGVVVEPSTLEMLRPFNVKSVSVLKGISAAIYGSRGGAGVVIIEMKKGGE